MKKIIRMICLSMTVVISSLLISCEGDHEIIDDGPSEKIDTARIQLNIANFNGGYGSEWLYAAKTRFEEAHKNDKYTDVDGTEKTGVQIVINGSKDGIMAMGNQILNNQEEIYFTEYAFYYQLKAKGYLLDITDAVTSVNTDGKTIESKLTAEQIDYYKDNGKYYGLPHYSGYSGLIYNIDLFESRGYYIKNGYSYSGDKNDLPKCFTKTTNKSVGPDGVAGTDDDGLPANYDEMYMLLDRISSDGRVPITWNGTATNDYLLMFLQSIVAQNEGLEQMMLNFDYGSDTKATTLGKIIDGQFVADENAMTITADNGYELSRQRGKYEALKLLKKIIETDEYHSSDPFGGVSHLATQKKYLANGVVNDEKEIAMLIDGVWWENEAKNAFEEVVSRAGSDYSRTSRRFGLLPLPSFDGSNKTNTLIDHIYSLCFIKSNVAECKKELAKQFVMFVNTDESLCEYSKITNTAKALTYTMSDADLAQMSPFGRSLLKMKQNSEVVYPYSQNDFYVNNQTNFAGNRMYNTLIGGQTYTTLKTIFYDNHTSAESYFSGIYDQYKAVWSGYVR